MLDGQRGAAVERVVEVALLFEPLRFDLAAEKTASRAGWRRTSSSVVAPMARGVAECGGDQVVGQGVLHQLQRFVEEVLLFDAGVLPLNGGVAVARGC